MTDSPNVELVRRIHAEHQRGDYSSSAWAHPDIEFEFADGPSPGRWRGIAGLADGFRDFLAAWHGFHSELEEVRELDGGRVAVVLRVSARGKASGLDVGQMRTRIVGLYEFRDGKVSKLAFFLDAERAFADLGLTREADAR